MIIAYIDNRVTVPPKQFIFPNQLSLRYVFHPFFLLSISGDTFRIPDSIMGLTFLAAGMSVPEAVSSVIVANQGNSLLFTSYRSNRKTDRLKSIFNRYQQQLPMLYYDLPR